MAKKREPVVLNDQHYDSIQDALARVEEIRVILPKATACGVNCDEYARIVDRAEEALKRIQSTWFPKGKPSPPK